LFYIFLFFNHTYTFFDTEAISSCNLELNFATALSIPNAFYPSCQQDGNYKEIQCRYDKEKKCWCVDENGNTMAGTETTQGLPNCTNGGKLIL
jgi:hypothetical protein